MKKKQYKVYIKNGDDNSIYSYAFKRYNYGANYKNLFKAFIRFKQLKRFAKELLKMDLYVRSFDVIILKYENDSCFGTILKVKKIFRKGDKWKNDFKR